MMQELQLRLTRKRHSVFYFCYTSIYKKIRPNNLPSQKVLSVFLVLVEFYTMKGCGLWLVCLLIVGFVYFETVLCTS